MQLLNHNINIKEVLYHIQTELINRKKVDVIISQIFQKGEVVWSKKKVYNKQEKLDFKKIMEDSHKNAILYLKKLFSGSSIDKYHIDILKLNKLIVKFKDDFGRGVFFIELFKTSDSTLIAGYNQNKFATDVYYTIYQELKAKLPLFNMSERSFQYYDLEISDETSLIVGNIEDTGISFSFLIDLNKIGSGMFFNAIYPKFISIIKQEVKG